jgi:hypothetical protein
MLAMRLFLIANEQGQYVKKFSLDGNCQTEIELSDHPEEGLAFREQEQAEGIVNILEKNRRLGFYTTKCNFIIDWPMDQQ